MEKALDIQYILDEIHAERLNQIQQHGANSHEFGNCQSNDFQYSLDAKKACNEAFKNGSGTWRHILMEEIAEVWAESDPYRMRGELLQVAAVVAAMIEDLDLKYNIGDKGLKS